MARWDEILTLPVQNPPTSEFSAADIVWSRVEGWRETMDRLALIPFTRVSDFVRGESNNKDCPTRFHVEARRRRPPETTCKPKVDGILEYILYWCSFGPDDHRKGGAVRPSRKYAAKKKTPAGRPNTKRGCVCHFIVKRLIAEPSVALIIYNQDKHVDKTGLPCHGPQDKKAAGTQAMFAPYISDELRLQIMSLLYVGVPVETIMQRHTEAVEKQGGPCNRDDLLSHRYVRRLERKIRRSTYELDSDDAVSIAIWIENHRDHIFFYEDFSNSEPFVLGIQTEWQLQQLIHFGNNSVVASDSRFGTNKLKYPIYSLLVFDSNNNAIPVAWIMTPNFASGEIHRWMGALYDRVRSKDPTWKLGGFIVDDPSADVLTIREVFQCSVLISFWRVRHAWHKNLMEKCSEVETRAEMSRRLGEIVTSICRGNGSIDSFEAFMEDFVDCSDFLDYFKGIWYPRIGMWTTALKGLPLASSEVSAAIECYHTQLKLRLLNEEDSSIYQRADWLVDKLGTKVHSYYWLDEYAGKENFARYWKDEWKSGLSSWRMASQIPDSDVTIDGKCAKVVTSEDRDLVHIVLNPGSEFAICECSSSRMGNLCEHAIKSAKVYRDKGLATASTSLVEYNQILMNILHCPPNDSVIRDHAVALAVSVQSQLTALFDLRTGGATSSAVPREQRTDTAEPEVSGIKNLDIPDEDLMNKRQSVSENSAEILVEENPSIDEKNDASGETACGIVADDTALPAKAPSSGGFSDEQELPNNDVIICDHLEKEAGFDSNAGNSSNESREEMLADASCDEARHLACGNQINNNTHENSLTETGMDIDPPLFQCSLSSSLSRSGVTNGDAEKGCVFQLSSVKDINTTDVSEGHPLNSTTVTSDDVSNGICLCTEKKTLVPEACSQNISEEINLDQNIVTTHDRTYDILGNGSSEGNTNSCGDGNVRDLQMVVDHNSADFNDVLLNSNNAKVTIDINHEMDVALVKEDSGDNITENRDGGPLFSAAAAVEDTSNKREWDHSLRDGNEPSTEVQSDPMEIEMSAVPVEGVHIEDSSGITKDSLDIAPDVPSVINGVT